MSIFPFRDVLRVPDWSQGCIYYQIFPERFAKSGKIQGHFDTWDAAPTRDNFLGGNLRGIIDYDRWRYHYPAFDDTSIRVPIPTEEPTRSKRGRKPKNKD